MKPLIFTFRQICRTCLGTSPEMINIFDKAPGLEISIADMIAQCSRTEISKGDSLPENICQTCLQDGRNAFETKQSLEKSHQILLELSKDKDPPANVKDSGDVLRKPHRCSECPKAYVYKYGLRIHMITHTGERPHRCPQCSRRFAHKCSLQRHILGHSGERTHQCPLCPKACSHKHDLKTHMRTHTGERPHRCSQCSKEFSHKGTLNKHLTTHYEERPHKCTLCSKAFSVKNYLQKHMKVHLRKGHCEDDKSGEAAGALTKNEEATSGEAAKALKENEEETCGKAAEDLTKNA